MPKPAVVAENLTKVYRIGQAERRADTLAGAVASALKAPARNFRNLYRLGTAGRDGDGDDVIRAVDDVSFEVQRGEVLGIIGRNGAGKSTLLKILSRITKPTSGRVRLRGRVSSLLEVGTGFHPELTGRENVYLNGTILGMTKREIDRKFDEIVDFSGVEKFLDTPVKRYSSGMKVRLAFAVAAHLEPDILIVDEVLAVGDAEFQRKCLGKMEDVAGHGRTVLFVSHNLGMLQGLCQRGILLQHGRLVEDAPIGDAVGHYLRKVERVSEQSLAACSDRPGEGLVRLMGVDIAADAAGALATGRPARFLFQISEAADNLACAFTVYDQHGQPIARFDSRRAGTDDERLDRVGNHIACYLDELLLMPGRYRINVAIYLNDVLQDHVEGATVFDVESGKVKGRLVSPIRTGSSVVYLPHRWGAAEAQPVP